jgi:CubicO group peptidase (beta-lactamase class C family)
MKTILLFITLTFFINLISAQDNLKSIDTLLNKAVQEDLFSGTVLIAENGKVVYKKSFGMSDWENTIPNNDSTKFNIGSIGKLFTQVLITQLYQEGKLDLNDKLSKYLNIYPVDVGDKITIKHLLTMSAGLGDYFRIPQFRQNPSAYKNVMDLIDLIKKEPLLFEPGISNEYSNSGYVVLGGIIEKITGESYLQNLYERILIPLAMKNSGFIYEGMKVKNRANGYMIQASGGKQNTSQIARTIPTPAGGMFSTVDDLFKMDISLQNDNKLLDDNHKAILFTRFRTEGNKDWNTLKSSPDFGFGIAGGSPGWNSVWDQNIAGKYTVIILSNYHQAAEEMLPRITSILKDKPYQPLTIPLNRFIYNEIKKNGINNLSDNFDRLIKENKFEIEDDMTLNEIGYEFLNSNMIDEAIGIFNINVRLFPSVANVYDSLGEAYKLKGNKEEAIKNYQKAVELNPKNENAKKILEDLKK